MFAVAAQTTVRATAQVKATKVAAKEQKSAYVPSRFPASSISRRFFHPRRSASARATARRRRRRIARGVRARTRRASTRIDTARIARRDGRARLRASSPSSSASREQRNRGNKSRGRDTHLSPSLFLFSARSSLSSKAAGAAAALFLFASPAAFADGLTLQNGTNSAPGKYEQPFYDPRPVVEVEKDSSADISTEAARVAANKQKGMKNCKTITGAPCVGSTEISSM
jgi:hypothetical protein